MEFSCLRIRRIRRFLMWCLSPFSHTQSYKHTTLCLRMCASQGHESKHDDWRSAEEDLAAAEQDIRAQLALVRSACAAAEASAEAAFGDVVRAAAARRDALVARIREHVRSLKGGV